MQKVNTPVSADRNIHFCLINTGSITASCATGRFYLFLFAAFSAITFLAHLNHLLASYLYA